MAIFIDQIRTHDGNGNGDDTVPPGVTGLDWCHLVSGPATDDPSDTGSLAQLQAFLIDNAIGDPANIRTPADGSICTYIGLMQADHDRAVQLGALREPQRVEQHAAFDAPSPSGATFYEPIL